MGFIEQKVSDAIYDLYLNHDKEINANIVEAYEGREYVIMLNKDGCWILSDPEANVLAKIFYIDLYYDAIGAFTNIILGAESRRSL